MENKENKIEISEDENEKKKNEKNEGNNEKEYNKGYNENISKELIKDLQLLRIKEEYNISEVAFDKILKIFEISGISLYKLWKLLENIILLKLTLMDCCINSYIVFIGKLINKDIYSYYKENHYKPNQCIA